MVGDIVIELLKDAGVNIEVKYRALQLLKDCMQTGHQVIGKIFIDRHIQEWTKTVIEEKQKGGRGECLFKPNPNPYERKLSVRCFKLMLNCLQAWIDVFSTINLYYTAFSEALTSGIEFPDFQEYSINLGKPAGSSAQSRSKSTDPTSGVTSTPLTDNLRAVKNYPEISSGLEMYRNLLRDIISNNTEFQDRRT